SISPRSPSTSAGPAASSSTRATRETPVTARDPALETLARYRLVRHPAPKILAEHAHRVADRIAKDGVQATRRASVLASRGLRASTGTISRSADQTTVVERAAGVTQERRRPVASQWAGVDARLSHLLRLHWLVGNQIVELVDRLMSTAELERGSLPAGTGTCRRCDRLCIPTPEQDRKSVV